MPKPDTYDDLGINEYRVRFGEETKRFTDTQLYNLVMETDDDMSDDEWREYFKNADVTA